MSERLSDLSCPPGSVSILLIHMANAPLTAVTAAYGVSWAYLIGDVSFTTYKSSQQGPTPFEAAHMTEPTRLGLVTVKRAVFQGVASMALPAFTIHSAVKYAGRQFAKAKSPAMKRWGPTAVGIGIVPFLPYLFDEPVSRVSWFRSTKRALMCRSSMRWTLPLTSWRRLISERTG